MYSNKPGIWIFGGSFTWGWPLDNDRVYPWLAQSGLQEYSVTNFAVNGFGNVHELAQLKKMLGGGPPPHGSPFSRTPHFMAKGT